MVLKNKHRQERKNQKGRHYPQIISLVFGLVLSDLNMQNTKI